MLGINIAGSSIGQNTSLALGPQTAQFVINDGAGNAQVAVPEGGSVEVSVDGRPTQTITDLPGSEGIGFLYPPSVAGSVTIGAVRLIDLGIVFYQGEGPITITQDILRDGVVGDADIRTSDGPETYGYTVLAGDIGQTVQLRSTLTNGANVVTALTDIVAPGDAPIIEAGSNGWYNPNVSDTVTLNNDGGTGDEVAALADQSADGNDLTQTSRLNMPLIRQDEVNGNAMLKFSSAQHYRLTPTTVRSAFFVLSDVLGNPTPSIAGVLGTDYDDNSATHKHIFIRADGLTDYDISVDGLDSRTGTVRVDTGASGSGGDITLASLTTAEREGTRLWYVSMDADIDGIDVIGAIRNGFSTHRNKGTLFGEIALFPTTLSNVQANAVANDIAARWGLTWSDIT